MNMTTQKNRDRFSSDAYTASDFRSEIESLRVSCVEFKPTEDPDTPPEFELQNLDSNYVRYPLKVFETFPCLERGQGNPRKMSYDGQYTIINFIDRKLRQSQSYRPQSDSR